MKKASRLARRFAQPDRPILLPNDDGHAVMHGRCRGVGGSGDDGEGAKHFRRAGRHPAFPNARKGHRFTIRPGEGKGLLARRGAILDR